MTQVQRGQCTHCGKYALNYLDWDFDGDYIVYKTRCDSCGKITVEVYDVTYLSSEKGEK